ncbi:transcription factor Sp2 isoform X2 [Seriola aureovittata]|uniref:transcription factor Sp2 isoform X2 n=1 Tax=Seriola aureovittata TaxID=2871759 RepID=UPI0024BEF6D9|nr:transcription factor Sp2 isoform X2 [Seriola aureovittata]
MSSRLAFQTQLASIMEVLANAAVAEICKLVDDEYAVVSLQMSQCQRENKALKRKLHLLELKMARGNAERRLRESAMNSSRPRVQIHPGDRVRESFPSTSAVFERQMAVALWSGRAAAGGATGQPVHSDSIHSKSPDVELVEPEALLVKEEKVEANMSRAEETEEDVPLIGDDGVLECVPRGAAGQRLSPEQQDIQSQSQSQTQIQMQNSRRTGNSRGAEDAEPEVVLVKMEEVELVTGPQSQASLSIQEGLVESSTDNYRGALPFDETAQASTNQLSDLQEAGGGFSECAAPQSTPMISEDSIGVVSVQLRVPDTNTPANPNTPPPPPPQRSSNTLSSKYSLFELDTFLSRWATDSDPVPTPGGPSCPFTADDTPECDQDRVIIVEEEPSVSSAVRISGGQSLSAGRSSGDIQPTASQGGISVSTPLRMQAPSSQRPWSRTITTNRRAQSQLLQQPRSSSSSEQQETVPLSSSRAAVTNTNSGDETSVSGISSTCRTMSSTVAPQAALPLRGSTAVLASIEAAIAAQRRAGLLACHSKSQAAGVAPAERRRKSYVCRACGKAFSGLSNLEAHERVHTGEKPFRCNTCGKHFSEAGNLKKHQRVHTGEKPFSCDQCGKKFAWICNLRTHQQSATGCGPQDRGGGGLA